MQPCAGRVTLPGGGRGHTSRFKQPRNAFCINFAAAAGAAARRQEPTMPSGKWRQAALGISKGAVHRRAGQVRQYRDTLAITLQVLPTRRPASLSLCLQLQLHLRLSRCLALPLPPLSLSLTACVLSSSALGFFFTVFQLCFQLFLARQFFFAKFFDTC